jgi:hypothetical protein
VGGGGVKVHKGSFGTIYNKTTGEYSVKIDLVVRELLKGWGNVPKYFSDHRAFEIYCLAKAYKSLQKEIKTLKQQTATNKGETT